MDTSPADAPDHPGQSSPTRPHVQDVWASGAAYEPYVGRWSRLVARDFLDWIAVPPASRWLDVGCGTGALSQTILQMADPASVQGLDRAEAYVAFARANLRDPRLRVDVGDAQALPVADAAYDAVVSGLMLNFVPRPDVAAREMVRVVRPGGVVAVYVWDYAVKMQFMRYFWDAAAALNPADASLDEARRFPICHPQALLELFQSVGLADVSTRAIEISTHFRDFDDYWSPFLGGQGAAPSYLMSLSEEQRIALREHLRASLPFAIDGSIPLVARAWAARGVRPA